MNLRILIADDEPLGRERLRQLLRTEPRTEIVAECISGVEAVNTIRQRSPDLVFLDVKMPDLDGFGVLESLSGARMPAVIFVTAYDQFAVRAFEAHAVDYLLKPFDRERLQIALRRARERLQRTPEHRSDQPLSEVLVSLETRLKRLERLTIKSQGRLSIVNTIDIDWIRAADNYAELHVGNTSHFLRMTLSALAERLPPNRFARISRSHLVNLERIKEIRSKSHGDFVVFLRDGTRLPGTRNYRHNLAGFLGKPD
jgi:two-component system LytT family response regulator